MSSTAFQGYVEEMNRQVLDKMPGTQRPSGLLPHQRTPARGLDNPSPTIYDDRSKGSASTPNYAQVAGDHPPNQNVTPDKDASTQHNRQLGTYTNGTSDLGPQPRSLQLQLTTGFHQSHYPPASQQGLQTVGITGTPLSISQGLAKSRWATLTPNSFSEGRIGQLSGTPSTLGRSKEASVVRKHVESPLRKTTDDSMLWKPDGKYSQSMLNEPTSPKHESSGPIGQSSNAQVSAHKQLGKHNPPEPSGWGDPESTSSQHQEQLEKHSTIATLAQTSEKETGGIEKEIAYSGNPVPDPRANWPTETGIVHNVNHNSVGQFQGWDQRSRNSSSDAASISTEGEKVIPSYVSDFIETWRQDAHSVATNFLAQGDGLHEDCDVDTYEGIPIEPVKYPSTKKDELMSRNQLELTATLMMSMYKKETNRRDPQAKAQRRAEKQAKRAANRAPAIAETETVTEALPNPNEVQIACYLRPAIVPDMEDVAAIYNQEIQDGYRMMDTKPVEDNEFRRLYDQCVIEKMPFIVAVEGWYGTMGRTRQRIIGFSLVTAVNRGIAGSYDTLSRRGGKLLVVVRPECRRKKVGTALIDIAITNCTGWYISKGGYQFVNSTHDWISNAFGISPRKWWYLELDAMIRSAETEEQARSGEEFRWIERFLEDKFNLCLKNYDEKCFYQERGMQWLDKLTFRRDCRTRGE